MNDIDAASPWQARLEVALGKPENGRRISAGKALEGRPYGPEHARSLLEALCALACLAIAWRSRRTSPELGVVLALVPLFFAWRSLFSYFFLIPLFASVAVARMPLGDLTPERARAAGALTLFALPARRLRLVARRVRAA